MIIRSLKPLFLGAVFLAALPVAGIAAEETVSGGKPAVSEMTPADQTPAVKKRVHDLEKLKKENPEKFKKVVHERKQKLHRKMKELKEKDPKKFEELQNKMMDKRQKKLERLRRENPEKYDQVMREKNRKNERHDADSKTF